MIGDNDSPWDDVLNGDESTAPTEPVNKEALKQAAEETGFTSREGDTITKARRRGRPRSNKAQFNHRISPESLELFEKIADQFQTVEKGELVERAIKALAHEVGLKN